MLFILFTFLIYQNRWPLDWLRIRESDAYCDHTLHVLFNKSKQKLPFIRILWSILVQNGWNTCKILTSNFQNPTLKWKMYVYTYCFYVRFLNCHAFLTFPFQIVSYRNKISYEKDIYGVIVLLAGILCSRHNIKVQ